MPSVSSKVSSTDTLGGYVWPRGDEKNKAFACVPREDHQADKRAGKKMD
jgi:hypothetical protein